MNDEPGTVQLRVQPVLARVCLAVIALGALTVGLLLLQHGRDGAQPGTLGALAAAVLVLFVLPVLGLRFFRGLGYLVSSDALTQLRGSRAWRRVAFGELTEVRLRKSTAFRSLWGIRRETMAIWLRGLDERGQPTTVFVSGQLVQSLGPLLIRVEEEVARRPKLIAEPLQRKELQRQIALRR